MDEIEQIVAELENIEERLTDLAMNVLSQALESGSQQRPEVEKRISQARRTVAKARFQLTGTSTD